MCVETKVIKKIRCSTLDKAMNRSVESWTRSDTFTKVLGRIIINNFGFILPLAAFRQQLAIYTAKDERRLEVKVNKVEPPQPYRSLLTSGSASCNEALKARVPCRKRCDHIYLKRHDSFLNFCNKRRSIVVHHHCPIREIAWKSQNQNFLTQAQTLVWEAMPLIAKNATHCIANKNST